MATYTGGDITEITWNHPTLGSGILRVKASEDNTYDLGGLRVNDDANQLTGDGTNIKQMNQHRWFVNVTCAWDMNINLDLEKINALAAAPISATWTITSINGSIYGGVGDPVGDLAGNVNNVTFPLTISGGGKLAKTI